MDVIYQDKKAKQWRSGLIDKVESDLLTIVLPLLGEVIREDRWSFSIASPGLYSSSDEKWRKTCLENENLCFYVVDSHYNYTW